MGGDVMNYLKYCILWICLVGCGSNSKNDSFLSLPSGKKVLVISIVNNSFQNREHVVELNYKTKIYIKDRTQLADELNDIWAIFQSYAEKQGATSAIIRAHEQPSGFLIKKNDSEAFVYKKVNGKWIVPGICSDYRLQTLNIISTRNDGLSLQLT